MTTLIEDVKALLNPLASGGAHYAVDDLQSPTYPYIVFTRISSVPNVTFAGPSNLQNTRMQVDIFSRSVQELDSICKAVDAAFAAWSVVNIPAAAQDVFEADVRAWRSIRDFSIWATN